MQSDLASLVGCAPAWRCLQQPLGMVVPQRPSPSHPDAPPLAAGPDRLQRMAARFLTRLTGQQRGDLRAWLLATFRGRLTVSTACSGTDSPILVWRALGAAAAEQLQLDLHVHHGFSCERSAAKRKSLRAAFPEACIFTDVMALVGEKAETHEGSMQSVTEFDCMIAGFP